MHKTHMKPRDKVKYERGGERKGGGERGGE